MNRSDEPEEVIAHALVFKGRLGIGEEAYKFLKLSKNLSTFIHTLLTGVAASGTAASSVVAGALFPATGFGSALAAIGLGAGAVTPIGWVVGAGFAIGGIYLGMRKLLDNKKDKMVDVMVDVIPKHINTPLDLIGEALLRLMLPLSLKIASADGQIIDSEVEAIADHYEKDWGYSRDFVIKTAEEIKEDVENISYEEFAKSLSDYCDKNSDCNRGTITDFLLDHLEEILEIEDEGDSARKTREFESLKKILNPPSKKTLKSPSAFLQGMGRRRQ